MAEVPAEVLARYSRFPDRVTASGPADEFLSLACLRYADDEPGRWARAREILREHPEVISGNAHVAAAVADPEALRRVLADDPAAARRDGEPFGWTPLSYLAYARHDPDVTESAVLKSARLLLDAGADPNAGYLWHGLPTPFTVLTGVFGEGELGPARQPRHPRSLALARLLLEAGADPNDGQALYNRMFEPGNDHLELLLDFGLGGADTEPGANTEPGRAGGEPGGGPWHRLLGDALESPAEMLRGQLAWAVTHGMTGRVRLLVERGHVDLVTPFGQDTESERGVTVTAMAATTGHADLVGYLVAHGAPPLDLESREAFIAAALAADRPGIAALLASHPGLAEEVRAARPALVAWAAACGSPAAVEVLVDLGFDVNARGRTDIPSDQPWQTALHAAAQDGNLELARALLRRGADPDIRDARFDGTPLSWARYFGQDAVADLLAPLTA
jgi:ankyrin repeat protein